MKKLFVLVLVAGAIAYGSMRFVGEGRPAAPALRLASTTSAVESGLLAPLVAAFEERHGVKVVVTAVGSGEALRLLSAGEADVALTHAPAAEQALVTEGTVARRTVVMTNELVVVGPEEGAAVITGAGDVRDVFQAIAGSGRQFVSRGDESGTHQRERALWSEAGVSKLDFVVDAGTGMTATLQRASQEAAYTLTDRASYLAATKDLELAILFQGDDELRNVYAVTERTGAEAFADFLRSPEGRRIIGGFGIAEHGEPLFTPAE